MLTVLDFIFFAEEVNDSAGVGLDTIAFFSVSALFLFASSFVESPFIALSATELLGGVFSLGVCKVPAWLDAVVASPAALPPDRRALQEGRFPR